MNILLADSHAVFRAGLRLILEGTGQLRVVGEAADGHEALGLVEQLRPDLAICAIELPGVSGLEVTRRIVKGDSGARVVILSMHEGRSYVMEALRAGASAYLVKSASSQELLQAIDQVRQGKSYLSPSVVHQVVESVTARRRASTSLLGELTSREREVLQLIAEGLSSKEIAAKLGLSVKTIESHRSRVMEKVGIHKVSGLVRFAVREGLLVP